MKSSTGREPKRSSPAAGERGKERGMGFLEEGRQLIQDFVTPEICSIDVRLSALEKRVESLEVKVDKRFDSVDKRFDSVDKRFDSLESKMERNQLQVLDTLHRMENYTLVMERLARLEGKLQNVA
jgi:tetrahydromethanopterin S-methyltransferase subunit G